METICEKISEYLKQNYVYSIYKCSSGKNVKGFRIYVDAKKKDGLSFDENDLKAFIACVAELSSRYNIVGMFSVEECYIHSYCGIGFTH